MTERATRTTQTRSHIKRAFTELVAEKGFGALTVSDITRRAGINRGTFYLHFVDKNDLLDQLEGAAISDLADILLAPLPAGAPEPGQVFPYEVLRDALTYVAKDYPFIAAISGRDGDQHFSEKLKRLIGGLFDQGLARAGVSVVGNETYPVPYAREMALSRVMAIISLWLQRECAETPEQVARMVCGAHDVAPSDLIG